jgi:uracil-DNA glycosylase family 4
MPIEIENTSQKPDTPERVLEDVRQFLTQEQLLFGDTVLIEHPTIRKDQDVTPKKQIVVEEPALFELPPPSKPPLTTEPWGNASSLDDMDKQICTCLKCALGHTRTKFVFGVGNPRATLMLVGEAPGADEDAQGEPFVGRAGQLLNKILEAINFKREDVYICNILKCRPPNNRTPQAEEVEQCIPYLKKQIELIKPKVILCLGLVAAQNILHTTEGLGKLRGRTLTYEGTPLMVTYHPAALLRNPNWKRPAWEDVQAVRKLHDELVKG